MQPIRSSISAPYASTVIPLFLAATNGLRHRMTHCMECGAELAERNGDTLHRLNDSSQPATVKLAGTTIPIRCGNCTQRYDLLVAVTVAYDRTIQLHTQVQSLYVVPAADKHSRLIHCAECGKVFHRISDCIGMVADNVVALENVTPGRLGPMETLCSFKYCRQVWAVVV